MSNQPITSQYVRAQQVRINYLEAGASDGRRCCFCTAPVSAPKNDRSGGTPRYTKARLYQQTSLVKYSSAPVVVSCTTISHPTDRGQNW